MRKIYIFGIPQHGNLGDQAIAEATTRFIEKFTDLKVVEIPMSSSQERAEEIKALAEPDDIIAWHGGGNIGTLWPNEEEVRLSVLSKFKDKKVILFPQSIFFDQRDRRSLESSKNVYNALKDGTMFLRERVSLEFAKKEFPHISSKLVPDMVFSLDFKLKSTERAGVMTLFRSDKEKAVRGKDQRKITALLDKKFERLTQSDTVVDEPFENAGKRSEFLNRIFDEIASHELVVTDRLHGMIFAYITGTPCVVFENSYHKIRSTYDTWLKDCKFIKLINSSEEVEAAAEYVMKSLGQKNKINQKENYKKLLLSLESDNLIDAGPKAPSVSVVIPVYNVEKYLDACVDSVVSQSYESLEVILVNDGSTDGSGSKCDEWAKKDERIKVVHKKNEGLNYARRDGFRVSSGEYVTFLDSDDQLDTSCIRESLDRMTESNADMAVFGFKEFSDIDKNPTTAHSPQAGKYKLKILSGNKEVARYALLGDEGFAGSHFMTAWGKVYKRQLINSADWKASNYRSYEDNFWTPQVVLQAKRLVLLDAPFYFYRRNVQHGVAGKTLGSRLVGNSINGKNVGYVEFIDLLYIFYERLAKDVDVDIEKDLREARYSLMHERFNHLIGAGLLESENNLNYFIEYWEEHTKRDKAQGLQIRKLDEHNKELNKVIAEQEAKIVSLGSIRKSARIFAGSIKRKALELLGKDHHSG